MDEATVLSSISLKGFEIYHVQRVNSEMRLAVAALPQSSLAQVCRVNTLLSGSPGAALVAPPVTDGKKHSPVPF